MPGFLTSGSTCFITNHVSKPSQIDHRSKYIFGVFLSWIHYQSISLLYIVAIYSLWLLFEILNMFNFLLFFWFWIHDIQLRVHCLDFYFRSETATIFLRLLFLKRSNLIIILDITVSFSLLIQFFRQKKTHSFLSFKFFLLLFCTEIHLTISN